MNKCIVTLIFVITTNQVFTQESIDYKYDIGIRYGLNPVNIYQGNYGVQLRNKLSNKWHLKYALTYNKTVSDERKSKELIYENGTDKILRTQGEYQLNFAGRFGCDYSPIKYLRLGVEVILGYGIGNSYLVDENEDPHYDGGMEHIYEYNNASKPYISPDQGVPNRQYVQFVDSNEYLNTGVSVQVGAYCPIRKRWEIGINYSPALVRFNLLKTKSKSNAVGPFDNNYSSFNVINHFINLVVKFKF
ncbi:MAG: hypothetical protein HUJ25_08825 [Crocinitomicaceae bacterium]|nr:hypothetical protein [Crocinitomicaceae bacterium]